MRLVATPVLPSPELRENKPWQCFNWTESCICMHSSGRIAATHRSILHLVCGLWKVKISGSVFTYWLPSFSCHSADRGLWLQKVNRIHKQAFLLWLIQTRLYAQNLHKEQHTTDVDDLHAGFIMHTHILYINMPATDHHAPHCVYIMSSHLFLQYK